MDAQINNFDATSWGLQTLQKTQYRRILKKSGESCKNLFECDGNLDCCHHDKKCGIDCTSAGKSWNLKKDGKCREHVDCDGSLLCCTKSGLSWKTCQDSKSAGCGNQGTNTFAGNKPDTVIDQFGNTLTTPKVSSGTTLQPSGGTGLGSQISSSKSGSGSSGSSNSGSSSSSGANGASTIKASASTGSSNTLSGTKIGNNITGTSGSDDSDSGAITGIIIGVTLAVLILVIICVVLYRKNSRESERQQVEKGMQLEANAVNPFVNQTSNGLNATDNSIDYQNYQSNKILNQNASSNKASNFQPGVDTEGSQNQTQKINSRDLGIASGASMANSPNPNSPLKRKNSPKKQPIAAKASNSSLKKPKSPPASQKKNQTVPAPLQAQATAGQNKPSPPPKKQPSSPKKAQAATKRPASPPKKAAVANAGTSAKLQAAGANATAKPTPEPVAAASVQDPKIGKKLTLKEAVKAQNANALRSSKKNVTGKR